MTDTKPQWHRQDLPGSPVVDIGWNDEGILLQDPIGDPRLDEVSGSTRNLISEIANALLAQCIEPTPKRVAAVARELGLPPLEPELLAGLLMEIWWIRFNDIVPDDIDALQTHLEVAPAPEHPCCRFLKELIRELTARCHGGPVGDGGRT
jgi:hypothetical protein